MNDLPGPVYSGRALFFPQTFDLRAEHRLMIENGPENLESYLNVQDVARRYGIDSKTVYRLAGKGELPAFKIGSQWRFSEEKLKEWESKQGRTF